MYVPVAGSGGGGGDGSGGDGDGSGGGGGGGGGGGSDPTDPPPDPNEPSDVITGGCSADASPTEASTLLGIALLAGALSRGRGRRRVHR
jgi:hypothetical protein